MADFCNPAGKVYIAQVLLEDICDREWNLTSVCCLDNFLLEKNQETLVNQRSWAQQCLVRLVDNHTYTMSYDLYKQVFSIDFLKLLDPNAVAYDVANVSQVSPLDFVQWTWDSSDTEDKWYPLNESNADGTPVVATITGGTDWALVDGTDFEIRQKEVCLQGTDTKYVRDYLVILAHAWFTNTLTTDDQDLDVQITFTPKEAKWIKLRNGVSVWRYLNTSVVMTNKDDNTDQLVLRVRAKFTYSWPVISIDDWRQELSANTITMEIDDESDIYLEWLPESDTSCDTTCD